MEKSPNEIAQFVHQVLSGISDGVRSAQEHVQKTRGVPIAVGIVNGQPVEMAQNQVQFELNVTVSRARAGKVDAAADGILLKLVGVTAKGEAEVSAEDVASHKIHFSVPVYFSGDYGQQEQTQC